MQVLDCSLRDGGYYTAWHFSADTVAAYLAAMEAAGVDIVEIGYRSFKNNEFAGAYKYCKDAHLRELTGGSGLRIAVMIDAAELKGRPDAVDALFAPAADSPVEMVRIAATASEVDLSIAATERLKELGYTTTINLMQVGLLPDDRRAEMAHRLGSSETIDVCYVADSFGGMLPDDITRVVGEFRAAGNASVGIHTHNNLGFALVNTMAALEAGVTHVDATVLGMGRGAGNAATEQLLLMLAAAGEERFDASALFDIVTGPFGALNREHEWGTSLPYQVSAIHNIHPSYAHRLLSSKRYSSHEVVRALQGVAESGKAGSYDEQVLADALNRSVATASVPARSLPSVPSSLSKPTALIVGTGESVVEHAEGIRQLIAAWQPLVLSVNGSPSLPPEPNDIVVMSNAGRLHRAADLLGDATRRKVLPAVRAADDIEIAGEAYDYGCHIGAGRLEIGDDGCTLPHDVVGQYAIALGARLGAERIYLVGFDAYDGDDPARRAMNDEMDEFFALFAKLVPDRQLVALTPTGYAVDRQSLYFHL